MYFGNEYSYVLQDAIYKKHSQCLLEKRICSARDLIYQGMDELARIPTLAQDGEISLDYLEGVAKLRYGLLVAAELLHAQLENKEQRAHTHDAQLLIEIAKECCISIQINSDSAGPGIFLVKQIVRQYGMAFLVNLTSDKSKEWVVPVHLRRAEEVFKKYHTTAIGIYCSCILGATANT